MKIRKQTRQKLLQDALVLAKMTQQRYDKLKSPGTQRVRNPFPMWQLVQWVLPVLPSPSDLVTVSAKFKLTSAGKTYANKAKLEITAEEAYGSDLWQSWAMSAQEVCGILQAKGFIVNPQTVHQMLSNLHCSIGGNVVDSVSARSNPGKGRPLSLYFVRK